jgi:HPt (histidine-containing phosphotransfer) domain-containing protein
VTFVVCLCAGLLAALAYTAYRARLQALKIRRIARERLRLQTDLDLQARELRESNRALEEALHRIEDLLAGQHAEASARQAEQIQLREGSATAGAGIETEEGTTARLDTPAEDPIWSDIDSAAVARIRNLRNTSPADLFDRLVELFESGSSRALVELRTALERGRFDDAAAISHKFASSAANVGALTFAQSVRELERLCHAGDAGHSLGLYLRLRAAHPRLMVILQGLRQKTSASA